MRPRAAVSRRIYQCLGQQPDINFVFETAPDPSVI